MPRQMVTIDEVFDLLGEERRRYALYYLHEQDGPVPIEELVEVIVEWEEKPPEQDESWERFDEIALDLQHTHLPKTAEVDFVQYDQEKGIIQVQETPRKFDAFVTIARLFERQKNNYSKE